MSGACSNPDGRVRVLIQCTGARIRRIELPPFAVHAGEIVCILWPLPAGTPEQEALLAALTLESSLDGLIVEPPGLVVGRLRGLLQHARGADDSPRVDEELTRRFGLNDVERASILARHGVDPATPVGHLKTTVERLLAIEGALAGSRALCFDVAGLDPVGVRRVCALASSKRREGVAALMLALRRCPDNDVAFVIDGDVQSVIARLAR